MDIINLSENSMKLTESNAKTIGKTIVFTGKELTNKSISLIKGLKKNNTIIFDAANSHKTRDVAEKDMCHFIINAEIHNNKDYSKQANSGLDHVIAKIMSKNGIKYAFSSKNLKKNINKEPKTLIPRIKQNLFLCNKYKVEVCTDNQSAKTILQSL